MKEKLGKTIYKIRVKKGLKQKYLNDDKLSSGLIPNVEKGSQMLSAEKFILLLEKMNVTYNEFVSLMDDEYLKTKNMIKNNLSEFVKRRNVSGLQRLAKEAEEHYREYNDIYFEHIRIMALAMSQLYQSNSDYESARELLTPIKDYLDNIKEWGFHELFIISHCLFLFEIEVAISFGQRALELIEENYSLYKNDEIGCVVLINLAIYTLDYEAYYDLSLKYSQLCLSLASATNNAQKALYAKFIYQIACFKLENGLFNIEYFNSLINIFKLLDWFIDYDELEKYANKHGIYLQDINRK